MKTVFAKPHCAELRASTQVAIALAGYMGVMDRTIGCDGDLELRDVTGAVEEFPVLVGLDLLIPPKCGDRLLASEKRVADHVAPRNGTEPLVFAAVHPDSLAVHQR